MFLIRKYKKVHIYIINMNRMIDFISISKLEACDFLQNTKASMKGNKNEKRKRNDEGQKIHEGNRKHSSRFWIY